MVTNSPRGLEPVRTLHGGYCSRTELCKVSADNGTALFKGDPVVRNAGGGVNRFDPVNASTAALQRGLLGVVAAVFDSNGKPLTHSQPTRGPFLDASTEGYVLVYTDPDQIYIANASASASTEMLGGLAQIAFGTYNSAAGISGAGVNLTVVASAEGEQVFRVLGVGELGWPDQIDEAAANNDVYVMIADHEYRRSFTRVGHGG